ncbi:MAG: hypothetical protein PHD61_04505 [Bacteroidales bacterium]|nr:hypothetical protein [Lentimicrobiaceae bacterium]MDD5694550.1 hypothetical protein [Bacteroidales bacterium]
MKRTNLLLILFTVLIFVLGGCLTVEQKEYTFELTGPNSGKLTIKYINIMSVKDDSLDISDEDFEELLSNYLYGESLETDYPATTILDKQLFEENGVLCGKIVLEFSDLAAVKLYRYKSTGPFMLNIGSFLDTETYIASNGDFGGDNMPVVFWPDGASLLTVTTGVTQPDETTVSLVENYQEWRKNN